MKPRIRSDRSIWSLFFLSLITLGMYEFWYYHKMVKDVNTICEEDGMRSPGVLMWFVLSILTFGIYNILWWCNMHDRMRAIARKKNLFLDQTTSGLMPLLRGR